MPWIDLKRFGRWCKNEACPFVEATAKGTLAGGPYMGIAAGMTATNKEGGNPLGKVGKDLEPIVQTGVTVAGVYTGVAAAADIANKAAEAERLRKIAEAAEKGYRIV